MNILPTQPAAPFLSPEPLRPAQQNAQEIARPVVAPAQTEAATQELRRNEERRTERKTHARGEVPAGRELTEDEQRTVDKLQQRDREVRAHEAAHQAAAGRHARGSAQFSFEVGPDGRRYAVGGEVEIDTSEVPDDPQATLDKARVIQRAANAPAEPSAQDRQVALQAAAMEAEAQRALNEQRSANMERFLASMPQAETTPEPDGAQSHAVGSQLDVFA